MSKTEAPLDALKRYIPEPAGEKIIEYLDKYKVHLTITKERKSVLGDYRHATGFQTHRISVNGTLNKYNFLITLIHELAHLVTFIQFRGRVEPHGREWKNIYAAMLGDFLTPEIFPADLIKVLRSSMQNLPASSCSDDQLIRALRQYDSGNKGMVLVEQIPEGEVFEAGKDKLFKKGKLLRKRYECTEVKTGRKYLFSPVYEVKKLEKTS
jgi:SprT protein